MQRYANVNGEKRLPFPKGRGTCPCCSALLIAKCGQLNAHHWAHESRVNRCKRVHRGGFLSRRTPLGRGTFARQASRSICVLRPAGSALRL